AGEVRNLAGRSAEAAREIRDLIAGSAREIDNGAELVQRAENTIESVVTSVTRLDDLMSEMGAAFEEQSLGIVQVNQAVARMDETTRLNAERVEASARTASQLETRMERVARAVAVFEVGETSATRKS